MFVERKNLRVYSKAFKNYRIKIKNQNNGVDFETYEISNISEDGANLFINDKHSSFEIGEEVFGTLIEKSEGVIVKFIATVVWKNGFHLGIKFHEEIIIPDVLLALQMAHAD
jgi:hypothetical protein